MEDYKPVPALEKAFAILDFLAATPEKSFGVSDIAKATGYNKGTLYFILKTLQNHDFIDKNILTGKYSLGHGVNKYVDAYYAGISDLTGFIDIAKKISSSCHECINLSVLKGIYNYVIKTVPAQDISLRVDLPVGSKIPATASSAGKVLISQMNDLELSKIYDSIYEKYEENHYPSKSEFLHEIHTVRDHGYAVNDGEYENGVSSAGAPIYNSAGKIIAAINIVLPSFRFTGENRIKIIRLAMAGAAELSAANKK